MLTLGSVESYFSIYPIWLGESLCFAFPVIIWVGIGIFLGPTVWPGTPCHVMAHGSVGDLLRFNLVLSTLVFFLACSEVSGVQICHSPVLRLSIVACFQRP